MCMLALGAYTFAVSVYGFLISNQESRGLISLVAILFSVAFLVQLFSIFTAFELRNKINRETNIPGVVEAMSRYTDPEDDTIKNNWDTMQRNLRCCGGINHETGYTQWGNVLKQQYQAIGTDVPDSCCHEEVEGCGRNKITQENYRLDLGIWKDGCIEILRYKLRDEVAPVLIIYSGVGVLLAIVELITVVLACSYIAQISRRRRRDELFTRAATANDEEYLPSLSKETNF